MISGAVLALILLMDPTTVGARHLENDHVARNEFASGVAGRQDAVEARYRFAKAAQLFDNHWYHDAVYSPALALNRGHAHVLAGNLPQAILAFHDGLALAPYDAELQQSLTAARNMISYPSATDPRERIRPDPPRNLRNRVAPWDLYRLASVSVMLLVVGLAKRFTTRPHWAVPVAALGGTGWLLVAGVGMAMHQERVADEAKPLAVVVADRAILRMGNGESYPPRIEARLPRGAELRVVGRRGGWRQVELPGGGVGWLPDTAVIVSGP
jgi:hypothetical protein